MADRDDKLIVWEDGALWCAKRGSSGPVARGRTRDEAIYFCGWWGGRRELGAAVERHVLVGAEADEACGNG